MSEPSLPRKEYIYAYPTKTAHNGRIHGYLSYTPAHRRPGTGSSLYGPITGGEREHHARTCAHPRGAHGARREHTGCHSRSRRLLILWKLPHPHAREHGPAAALA